MLCHACCFGIYLHRLEIGVDCFEIVVNHFEIGLHCFGILLEYTHKKEVEIAALQTFGEKEEEEESLPGEYYRSRFHLEFVSEPHAKFVFK